MPKSQPAKAAAKAEKSAPAKAPKAAAKPASAPAKAGTSHKEDAKEEKKPRTPEFIPGNGGSDDSKLSPFLKKQKERLLHLRDNILDSMNGVAKDTLRARAEGSEASAFGMHQADAGSDAYDRDFALSLLSQEQDALYEIEEALKRLDAGTYGTCEMSGKPIAHARLEAIPFARYTVECQAQIEKQNKIQRSRTPVTSLFGLTDDEGGGDGDDEEPAADNKEEKD
jgi:DnaK suppressor protein